MIQLDPVICCNVFGVRDVCGHCQALDNSGDEGPNERCIPHEIARGAQGPGVHSFSSIVLRTPFLPSTEVFSHAPNFD